MEYAPALIPCHYTAVRLRGTFRHMAAMEEKFAFIYRGFTLHCDPTALDDGRFGAEVVIEDSRRRGNKDHVFKPLGCFDSEDQAANCSFEYGKRWVDSHA